MDIEVVMESPVASSSEKASIKGAKNLMSNLWLLKN